jgi:broad specificity phosphatase PhoE
MQIFFIRHGETTGDIENRYGGDYDDHLSEKGRKQSEILAAQLKNKGIKTIFTSSLVRAQETSSFIAKATGAKVEVAPLLRERNQYGILTGMKKEEAVKDHPDLVDNLKDGLNTIEGAESYEAFAQRIISAFEKITNDPSHQVVAIVSHGGPLRVLFRDILKWGELKDIGDCAFVELEKKGDTFSWIHSGGFTPSFQIPTF